MDEVREKFYMPVWIWSGALARIGFVIGMGLLVPMGPLFKKAKLPKGWFLLLNVYSLTAPRHTKVCEGF